MAYDDVFEAAALCPNCGTMDAGMDSQGNILCFNCGFITVEEIEAWQKETSQKPPEKLPVERNV
ncbi:MAG: hypothetical protein PHT13_00015 [Methanosarcina sp.]|nr:hypothetical protein [Methanosarcina sp.]